MKPAAFILSSVDMMQSIMRNIVYEVTNQKERPKTSIEYRIYDDYYLLKTKNNNHQIYHKEQRYWQN